MNASNIPIAGRAMKGIGCNFDVLEVITHLPTQTTKTSLMVREYCRNLLCFHLETPSFRLCIDFHGGIDDAPTGHRPGLSASRGGACGRRDAYASLNTPSPSLCVSSISLPSLVIGIGVLSAWRDQGTTVFLL